jgi:hypothetical protein
VVSPTASADRQCSACLPVRTQTQTHPLTPQIPRLYPTSPSFRVLFS